MCCQESGEREANVALFCPKAAYDEPKVRKLITRAPADCMCRPCTAVEVCTINILQLGLGLGWTPNSYTLRRGELSMKLKVESLSKLSTLYWSLVWYYSLFCSRRDLSWLASCQDLLMLDSLSRALDLSPSSRILPGHNQDIVRTLSRHSQGRVSFYHNVSLSASEHHSNLHMVMFL